MLNTPRFVLAPVEFVPVLSIRFAGRLLTCLLLTVFNVAVIVTCSPSLFEVSAHHPLWLVGVIALVASLLGSLLRVWFLLIFRGRSL
jgi:uncharacterized integral membrane protein